MVSTTIVHVIGTATLLAILTMVSLYVSTETNTMIYTNIKRNLQNSAEVIALQVKYLLYANTNISQILDYPLEVAYNTYYNIYIGTGEVLNSKLTVLPQLLATGLYVVAITPDEKIYGYSMILNTTTLYGKPIVLSSNPIIFGSSTITKLNITHTTDEIIVEYEIMGYKT